MKNIVAKFDENIIAKASSHEVKEIWQYVDATFSKKANSEDFLKKVSDDMRYYSE